MTETLEVPPCRFCSRNPGTGPFVEDNLARRGNRSTNRLPKLIDAFYRPGDQRRLIFASGQSRDEQLKSIRQAGLMWPAVTAST